jgi:hypothetical protein
MNGVPGVNKKCLLLQTLFPCICVLREREMATKIIHKSSSNFPTKEFLEAIVYFLEALFLLSEEQ